MDCVNKKIDGRMFIDNLYAKSRLQLRLPKSYKYNKNNNLSKREYVPKRHCYKFYLLQNTDDCVIIPDTFITKNTFYSMRSAISNNLHDMISACNSGVETYEINNDIV